MQTASPLSAVAPDCEAGGQNANDTHATGAIDLRSWPDAGDAVDGDLQPFADLSHCEAIDRILILYQQRDDLMKLEGDAKRQILSRCRMLVGPDHPEEAGAQGQKGSASPKMVKDGRALFKAISTGKLSTHQHGPRAATFFSAQLDNWHRLKGEKLPVERQLAEVTKTLPIWQWAEDVYALSPVGVGLIVGAAGDLSRFATVSKLWKWMCLDVTNGEARRRRAGSCLGANPRNRALMFMMAAAQVMRHGPFEAVYRRERARHVHRYVCLGKACGWRLKTDDKVTKCPECDSKNLKDLAHLHANRVTAKELLREMWIVWTGRNPDRALLTDRP